MGDSKEIEIAGKTIGEGTKISLSVKTALWIIGLVIVLFSTVFTASYFNIKSEVKSYKEQIDKDKQEFIKQVEDNINAKLDKQRDKDEEFIKSIEEIKGNVKLLIDRTQNVRIGPIESGTPTINNNIPTTSIPKSIKH